jgi:SNF2 family DNA or RNA helicase
VLELHGSWVLATAAHPEAALALWVEQVPTRQRASRLAGPAGASKTSRRRGADRTPRHPHALAPRELTAALATVLPVATARRPAVSVRSWDILAWLPTLDDRPLPSRAAVAEGREERETPRGRTREDVRRPALALWRMPAQVYSAPAAVDALLALAGASGGPALDDSLRVWIAAARLALELLCRQRFAPALEQERGTSFARWRPLLDDPEDRERFAALADAMPPAGRSLSWGASAYEPAPDAGPRPPEQAPSARRLLYDFLCGAVDGIARGALRRGRGRGSTLGEAWWSALHTPWGVVEGERVQTRERTRFDEQYRAWIAPRGPAAGETFRVCFRLEPPVTAPPDEPVDRPVAREAPAVSDVSDTGTWTLRYLLQATDDPSLLVSADQVWRQRGATARFVDRRFEQPQERLLAGLGRAARLFPPLERSLERPAPEGCALETVEAHRFLQEAALLLRGAGFGVLVPGFDSRLRLRMRLHSSPAEPARGSAPAALAWDSLVAFDWQVALGDQTLSRQEFEALARLKTPLVQVRGQWVELDPQQVGQALAFLERGRDGGALTLEDALKLALVPDAALEETGLPVDQVSAEGWIEELLGQLRGGTSRRAVDEPPGFEGTLRPYQKTGVAWLAGLSRYGVGACLADDMGLGKTIQLIALLLHTRSERQSAAPAGDGPVLLVCPTSVVGNWARELARFAPDLRVMVHHGAGRTRQGFAAEAAGHDVVISTYALLHRDEAELMAVAWHAVVADEAQNIKNAATRAAQTARKLTCHWRAALTGTPVENRLSELWSIFHFLNPGLLGSAEAFRRRFGNPIERANDAAAAARLKALVSPFILRRLKTDQSIIRDLPEKLEANVYCSLTREQATLYEAVVRDALQEVEGAEGIRRRGLVLATLSKLKQVCDHPALFLHDRSALDGRSGKLARLTEMLEEALATGDRALVFTQYAEMGRLLAGFLETRFGEDVLYLHGGTPARTRDTMVALFQDEAQVRRPHVFVLSLKAGGTGLNLTAASHVFHFDRWWNPAVENQATDRAFRIGQQKNVQVHKLVCAGTLEETIDDLIERKRALSEAIVGTGEAWLTEMSTAELRDLLTLRREALSASADRSRKTRTDGAAGRPRSTATAGEPTTRAQAPGTRVGHTKERAARR